MKNNIDKLLGKVLWVDNKPFGVIVGNDNIGHYLIQVHGSNAIATMDLSKKYVEVVRLKTKIK